MSKEIEVTCLECKVINSYDKNEKKNLIKYHKHIL